MKAAAARCVDHAGVVGLRIVKPLPLVDFAAFPRSPAMEASGKLPADFD